MSIAAMTHVWKDAPVSGTELLMLLAIADSANDDLECYPSIAHLAKKARCSTRQATRIVRALEQQNLIEIETNGARGRGKVKAGKVPNVYRITPDKWGQMTSVTGDMDVTPTPDMDVTPTPDMDVTQNHHKEPSVEPSSRKRDALFDAIAEVWNTQAGGYVGQMKAMLLGKSRTGEWKSCNFDPPVTAEEVLAFGAWWKRTNPTLSIPTTPETIQRRFYEFSSEMTKKAAAKIIPIVSPVPVVPILLQRQQEVETALREAQ